MVSTLNIDLQWTGSDIAQEVSAQHINWEYIRHYAIETKFQRTGSYDSCSFAPSYHKGGQNLVRLLIFGDCTHWVVRTPLKPFGSDLVKVLGHEVDTMSLVKKQSGIPVPDVYGFDLRLENQAGTPFVLMEFIPGNTAMDSFGGYRTHRGETPTQFRSGFHQAMADIQVQMTSIRFCKIGAITKQGEDYVVGPLPGLGGPFSSAADFFTAWAEKARFRWSDEFIRQRTPKHLVEAVQKSIKAFPPGLKELSRTRQFLEGPFPLLHIDFYNSNVIITPQHDIMSVIDWDGAFVGPWEIVAMAKDLSIIPAALDGPLFAEDDAWRTRAEERKDYVNFIRTAEETRSIDCRLSSVLSDTNTQDFAEAFWLFQIDGRIGFFGDVLRQL